MFDFEKCRFGDAEISNVVSIGSELHVSYEDWREQKRILVFMYVAGYQSLSPEGRALSHGIIETEDPFLSLACEMAGEDLIDGFRVFSFVSAWNDAKVLRVVAKGVSSAG